MLNFLSFLVLLYVSGHFKQKFFFSKFFRLIEKFITKSRSFSLGLRKFTPYQSEHFELENFTSSDLSLSKSYEEGQRSVLGVAITVVVILAQ